MADPDEVLAAEAAQAKPAAVDEDSDVLASEAAAADDGDEVIARESAAAAEDD